MDGKTWGFTAKAVKHGSSFRIRIPDLVVRSADLEDGELLELELRNQAGETTEMDQNVETGGNATVYIFQQVSEELQIDDKDLIDVKFRKD